MVGVDPLLNLAPVRRQLCKGGWFYGYDSVQGWLVLWLRRKGGWFYGYEASLCKSGWLYGYDGSLCKGGWFYGYDSVQVWLANHSV